ncbi:uroporphyrinogen-III synthase [Thalassotalea sp. SU-HH00458]|uniref:uroporphyrinogen-III synthase n=1 Tax=Thalassotalea sp. SU-HH00458 TaxID=3127657 RepID=UPI003101C653
MSKPFKVAITRPQQQGLALQDALNEVGISSLCQPLFTYRLNTTQLAIAEQVEKLQPSIVIFISAAAVEYANQAFSLSSWINSKQLIVAVGKKTLTALTTLGIQAICPELHNSEGILALPQFIPAQIKQNHKNILIVRGDGGREFLAEQLCIRGADVEYLESYRREWLALSSQDLDLWQQENINTIIITSNDLLKRVVELIDVTDNYWQNTCLWLVVSERIAHTAKQLGLKNIVNAHSANNQTIISTLLNMESKND